MNSVLLRPHEELAKLADQIENTPNNRHLIAKAVRLVAEQMVPCEDCGRSAVEQVPQSSGGSSPVIDPADNPEAGA